ncbi:MAG: DUF4339 domain-containing protein [Opitutales bacterium]
MKMCVVLDGKRNGPHEPQEIRRLYYEGILAPKNLAWKSGMQDWKPLLEVWPELFEPKGDFSLAELLVGDSGETSAARSGQNLL